MSAALEPSRQGLLDELLDLEARVAVQRSAGDVSLQAEADLAGHRELIFNRARRHIRACFPSFWGPIGATAEKVHRKFGTFFRELNLYHFTGPQIGKIVYDDKLIFDALISAVGYRSPKAVWMVDGSQALKLSENKRLALADAVTQIGHGTYFAKLRIGGGGEGAFMIRDGALNFADGRREPATADALVRLFTTSKQTYLLQDVATQIDALSALNRTSLNTIRCLSYLDRSGKARVLGATLRVGAGDMVVDNASSGGLFCGVDLHRGCLFGTGINKAGQPFTRHPTSQVVLKDYEIPGLEHAFAMCARCHEAIGHPMTVGWDAVIAPGGPMLLEGNPRWMAKLHSDADPGVAARIWAAHLDDWGGLDFRFHRVGLARSSGMRDRRLNVTVRVAGKVQKVGYRNWVARQATERALSGDVRNLEDGTVEVRLAGPIRRVEAMLLLLANGPRRAQVSEVTVEAAGVTAEDNFAILT